MNTLMKATANYNDFSELSRLRVDAKEDSQAALQEVAKQFESIFVQMMIKSMREASVPLQGELFNSEQSKAYTDMYDKQLGLELTKNNGIGLADVIVRQLSKQPAGTHPQNETSTINSNTLIPTQSEIERRFFTATPSAVTIKPAVQTKGLQVANELQVTNIDQSPHWQTPEDFIRDSWPHAQRAGEALGVDPRAILAQSALETGWGKKVHSTDDGVSSYSLFGIKADSRWQGNSVQFNTLEFSDGSMNREKASFRAYDSVSEAYQDYVDFIKNNARYEAVFDTDNSAEYADVLQDAGYATDPDYANKIESIRNGDLMNDALSSLKLVTMEPLT